MLQTITPREMKSFEAEAMLRIPVSSEALMHRAAASLADEAEKLLPKLQGNLVLFCGRGNNGGDGLAMGRVMLKRYSGLSLRCFLLPGTKSRDFERELQLLNAPEIRERVHFSESIPTPESNDLLAVDALFGTGLSRPLVGLAAEAVHGLQVFHEQGIPVLAVDVPSGLDGESGKILGCAVVADWSVTFHRPKIGLYIGDGIDCAGKIIVGDIGLNVPETASFSPDGWNILEKKDLSTLIPPRRQSLHKGNCGKLLLFAGSQGMAGAAAIAAKAALRTGAGLVRILCPESILLIVQTLCPCATATPLPTSPEAVSLAISALDGCDAFAAGCGIGRSAWAAGVLNPLLKAACEREIPTVLDADALNLISEGAVMLPNIHELYITPHPGEAARLLSYSTAELTTDLFRAARLLGEKLHAAVVMKGARSVLFQDNRFALNPFGTPAMAKGGSGDVLCGILGALAAGKAVGLYRMNPLKLMQCACALHGLAGEKAEKKYGTPGVLATDLCDFIGSAYLED